MEFALQLDVFLVAYRRFFTDMPLVADHNGFREINSGRRLRVAAAVFELVAIAVADVRPKRQGEPFPRNQRGA